MFYQTKMLCSVLMVLAFAFPCRGQGIVQIIDATGDGAGNELDGPDGIASDGAGNVYLTGGMSDNVFRITPDGMITQIIDSNGDGMGNSLNGPYHIAVDGQGNVYVTGFGSNNAFKITPGGVVTEIIDITGDGAGNLFTLPRGIAVDMLGNVYVTGGFDNAFKITTSGIITQIIDSNGDGMGNTLDGARDIAVDIFGNVYVNGCDSSNVFKISPSGVITEIIDSTGDGENNTLDRSQMIAVDDLANVYVGGIDSDNAFKIAPDGSITEIIDSTGDGTGNGLSCPGGLAVDRMGNVYVIGIGTANAFQVTPDGAITEIIDSTGDGAGNMLRNPIGIAVDGSRNVYVSGYYSDNAFVIKHETILTDHTYWLEIATHGAGAYGSQWRTLAVARNTGDADAWVAFVLHTAEGEHEFTATIPSGAQGVFDDIVGAMGVEEKGSLEIRSSEPLDVVGRIYNHTSEGTFGQFVDGFPAGWGLSRGESAWLLGLRQLSGVYRTNLSVTNTGASPATVEVTLFATDGTELIAYTLHPGPSGVIQDPEPLDRRAGEPDLGWGFAKVTVSSGEGVLTSASVVDSRTNDATTIAMKRPGCERAVSSSWLEIASHSPGAYGSEWRTLLAARNLAEDAAVVTLVLHTSGGRHEITGAILAGAQGIFDDVIGIMGIEGKGSLEIRSSQPLDVIGRIYNETNEGTFGQFLDGNPADRGLSTGESAWLHGLRQEAGLYRTNLTVTNTGTTTATVEVTLYAAAGSVLTSYALSLGPSEVIQDPEPFDRRAGKPKLGWGFARVTVTSGQGVLTSASVVDSRTNDATTMAMKRPLGGAGCPPDFAGIMMVTATAEGELTVVWMPAMDDATPAEEMLYHVYLATEESFEPGPSNLATTLEGASQVVLRGLAPATGYHVLVVAEDGNGLRSDGGGSMAARTLEVTPVMKPGAVLERAQDLGLGEATADGTELVFVKGPSAVLPTVGAHLVGPLDGGGGYLRTVEGVSETASEIVIETSLSSLEDIFDQFQILTIGTVPDAQMMAKEWADRSDGGWVTAAPGWWVAHEDRAGGSKIGRLTWADRLLTIETTRHAGSSDGVEYAPGPEPGEVTARLKGKDAGEVTLDVSLDFCPALITNATWTLAGVQTAEVIAEGRLNLQALAQYEWSAAGEYQQTIPIFTRPWHAVYSVGPLLVYQEITLVVEAEISASASAAVTAEAAASATAVVEVGARYTAASGWQPISNLSFTRSLSADLSVAGGVSAEVRIVPRLEVEFYKVISAWISIEPSLGGEITAEANLMPICGPFQLTAFDFDLDAEAAVGIDFTLFWRETIFEETVWDPPPWVLFNLPEVKLSQRGTNPVEVTASVADGVSNPFSDSSILWHVSPATGEVSPRPGNPRQAVLWCAEDGEYTVTFSGHGRLGELARRCNQLEVSCRSAPPDEAPELVAGAVSSNAINLSWTAIDGATGYRLLRGSTEIYVGTAKAYSDSSLNPATRYCYVVRAFNDTGNGPSSEEECATTLDEPLDEPPDEAPILTAVAQSSGKIRLSWTAVTGATGYRLFLGSNEIHSGAGTSLTHTGLDPATEYCYSALAFNDVGDGPMSEIECATTHPETVGCDEFPPAPGETWTYRIVGTTDQFTLITERVNEQVGRPPQVVYRSRATADPPGLGIYVGCDMAHGPVSVASDVWDALDPYNSDYHDRFFWEPPSFGCQYGDPIGMMCEWSGTFGGAPESSESRVLAYESVTVPAGVFGHTMKVVDTAYDEDGPYDGPMIYWIDEHIGIVRGEEQETRSAIELVSYSGPKEGQPLAAWWVPAREAIRRAMSKSGAGRVGLVETVQEKRRE